MMDLQNERWVISCDDCDEVFDTECKDAGEAKQTALENGWSFEGRYHYCQTCTEEREDDED